MDSLYLGLWFFLTTGLLALLALKHLLLANPKIAGNCPYLWPAALTLFIVMSVGFFLWRSNARPSEPEPQDLNPTHGPIVVAPKPEPPKEDPADRARKTLDQAAALIREATPLFKEVTDGLESVGFERVQLQALLGIVEEVRRRLREARALYAEARPDAPDPAMIEGRLLKIDSLLDTVSGAAQQVAGRLQQGKRPKPGIDSFDDEPEAKKEVPTRTTKEPPAPAAALAKVQAPPRSRPATLERQDPPVIVGFKVLSPDDRVEQLVAEACKRFHGRRATLEIVEEAAEATTRHLHRSRYPDYWVTSLPKEDLGKCKGTPTLLARPWERLDIEGSRVFSKEHLLWLIDSVPKSDLHDIQAILVKAHSDKGHESRVELVLVDDRPGQVLYRIITKKIRVAKIRIDDVPTLPRDIVARLVDPYRNRLQTPSDLEAFMKVIVQEYASLGCIIATPVYRFSAGGEGDLSVRVREATRVVVTSKDHESAKDFEALVQKRANPFSESAIDRLIAVANWRPHFFASRNQVDLTKQDEDGPYTELHLTLDGDRGPWHVDWDLATGSRALGPSHLAWEVGGRLGEHEFEFTGTADDRPGPLGLLALYPFMTVVPRMVAQQHESLRYSVAVYPDWLRFNLRGGFSSANLKNRPLQPFGEGPDYGLDLSALLHVSFDSAMWIKVGIEGLDEREVIDHVKVSEEHVRALTAALSMESTDGYGRRSSVTVGIRQGLRGFLNGTLPGEAIFTPEASDDFTVAFAEANLTMSLGENSSAHFALAGQFTRDPLLRHMQFNIGGPARGCAYASSEAVGDSGVAAALEIQTPPLFLGQFKDPLKNGETLGQHLKAFVSAEWASATLNDIRATRALISLSAGLSVDYWPFFHLKLGAAWPFSGRPSLGDGGGPTLFIELSLRGS